MTDQRKLALTDEELRTYEDAVACGNDEEQFRYERIIERVHDYRYSSKTIALREIIDLRQACAEKDARIAELEADASRHYSDGESDGYAAGIGCAEDSDEAREAAARHQLQCGVCGSFISRARDGDTHWHCPRCHAEGPLQLATKKSRALARVRAEIERRLAIKHGNREYVLTRLLAFLDGEQGEREEG
jgi:hypothetical protein